MQECHLGVYILYHQHIVPFTDSFSEEDSDLKHMALTITGIVIYHIEEAQACHAECRHKHCCYLTHPKLLLNPQDDTPWQVLYDS